MASDPDVPTPIAVLIPALNEGERMAALLTRLQELGFNEIVVADGGSRDDTAALARAHEGVQVVTAQGGRGQALNAAARAAAAPILFALHADSLPPDDAPALIRAGLGEPGTIAGSFRLEFDRRGIWFSFYAWLSGFETAATTFGDQGFFMTRTAFDAAGGFPDWPLLEDVEMRRRLKRQGRFVKLNGAVRTSARRLVRRGALIGQVFNVFIVAAFYAGVSPQTLARWYGHEPLATGKTGDHHA